MQFAMLTYYIIKQDPRKIQEVQEKDNQLALDSNPWPDLQK